MNAKNIISAILMVLSFAACSSDIEGFDDNMTNNNTNNGETSISVRMVMEGVSTKAGTTIDLTTEEAAIKNYVIAVFEEKSGERVGYASGTANGVLHRAAHQKDKGVQGGDQHGGESQNDIFGPMKAKVPLHQRPADL